jgi:hypothetical protein
MCVHTRMIVKNMCICVIVCMYVDGGVHVGLVVKAQKGSQMCYVCAYTHDCEEYVYVCDCVYVCRWWSSRRPSCEGAERLADVLCVCTRA